MNREFIRERYKNGPKHRKIMFNFTPKGDAN